MFERITIFCFAASYTVALVLEVLQVLRKSRLPRVAEHIFAGAGLFAHTFYLIYHGMPLQEGPSSLLYLAWVLAVFYLYGALHHRDLAWGIFTLPVVVGLVLVAYFSPAPIDGTGAATEVPAYWVWLHIALLMLGAVGLCVGFMASVMYLTQQWRLKHKVAPGEGLRVLSLERLEQMHRRAILLAFPLLTGGMLIGLFLLIRSERLSWFAPKVLSAAVLWVMLALLLYVRYRLHQRGRRVAVLTIVAFGFLVVALVIQFSLTQPSGGAS